MILILLILTAFFTFKRSFIMSSFFGPKIILSTLLLTLDALTLVVSALIYFSLFFDSDKLFFRSLFSPKILFNNLILLPRQKNFFTTMK